MTEYEQRVCAIALFLQGHSNVDVGRALGVERDRAQELIEAGAEDMRNEKIGYMKAHPRYEKYNPKP